MTREELATLLRTPVRHSRLRNMSRSAAHYAENAWEETGDVRKGTGLHGFMLGQESRIVLYEGGARNPKFEKYQEFMAKHPGKTILIPSEMEPVLEMKRSLVERYPLAYSLLQGEQERTIFWDFGGRKCQSTPDNIIRSPSRELLKAIGSPHVDHPESVRLLVELKGCNTSQPERFMWHARRMFYHSQLAFYDEALARTPMYPPCEFTERLFVVCEMTRPHVVTMVRHCDSMLSAGTRCWRAWFEKLMGCEESGRFPGYVDGVVDWEDEHSDGDDLDWENAAE